MAITKKKTLIIHGAPNARISKRWLCFRDDLETLLVTDSEVALSSINDLVLQVSSKATFVRDSSQGHDLKDFDLVIFTTVGKRLEMAIAAAAYCRKQGVRYVDNYIPRIGNTKLSCAFVRWEHGLPIPITTYGPRQVMIEMAAEGAFGSPFIVKDDKGVKGRLNFLVTSETELEGIFDDHPDTAFIIQRFISNDGDYRLLTFNGHVRMAILRQGKNGSHLNNVSQGGLAQEVAITSLDKRITALAEQAARLDKLAIAGVDIIVDKNSGQPTVLEVNRVPQIFTGALTDIKIKHYAHAVRELLEVDDEKY